MAKPFRLEVIKSEDAVGGGYDVEATVIYCRWEDDPGALVEHRTTLNGTYADLAALKQAARDWINALPSAKVKASKPIEVGTLDVGS